jgi:cell wall-associated NlpC family hydrolase
LARFTKRRSNGALRTTQPAHDRSQQQQHDDAAHPPLASTRRLRRGGVANIAVMAVSAGIVGTLAIPAYAIAPGSLGPQFGTTDQAKLTEAAAQSVEVADDVIAAPKSTDAISAVSGDEIRAQEAAAAAAAAAEAARVAAQSQMASYAASASGPSVSELLAAPPYPNFDLASVYNVATQYIGTPYVYGGATPAGFDCSGFVMYVYAQFGISMPHSSTGQGAMGTPIAESAAVPGDLVIMSGHDGFYAGNGMILHAPYEGASVRVQPIWTSDYKIVRIGI